MVKNHIALRVLRTLLELVKDRGYVVPDDKSSAADENYGVMRFTGEYVDALGMMSNMSMLVKHASRDTYMYIYVCAMSGAVHTPCRSDVKSFISMISESLKGMNLDCAMFVSEDLLSTINLKLIETLSITDPNTIYQTYLFDELLFNPTRHVLVPKHRLLTQEEQDKLYRELSQTLTDPRPEFLKSKSHKNNVMPVLRLRNIHGGDFMKKMKNEEIGDPIAKWYMARPSDVFEITRRNLFSDTTVGESLVYKYVT